MVNNDKMVKLVKFGTSQFRPFQRPYKMAKQKKFRAAIRENGKVKFMAERNQKHECCQC
jgi:hypothetical protein